MSSRTEENEPPYLLTTYSCHHTSPEDLQPFQAHPITTTILDHPCIACIEAFNTLATQRIHSHYAARIQTLEDQLKAASQRVDEQVWGKAPVNEFLLEAIEEKKAELTALREREKNMVMGVREGFKAVWGGLEE